MTDASPVITYASVVTRETVQIALTIAALNGLSVKCGDVMNAYITAPVTKKIWTKLGPNFGAHYLLNWFITITSVEPTQRVPTY